MYPTISRSSLAVALNQIVILRAVFLCARHRSNSKVFGEYLRTRPLGVHPGAGIRAAKDEDAACRARRYSQERKPATEVTPPRGRAPGRRVASPVGSPGNEKQDFMGLHRTMRARRGCVQDQLKANENHDTAMHAALSKDEKLIHGVLFQQNFKANVNIADSNRDF